MRRAMIQQNECIAKEAFTFPLICLVCLVSFSYWGCTDGWLVGAIVGTSFFGIITLIYIFKYLRFGRDFLRIDGDDIEIKNWMKITILRACLKTNVNKKRASVECLGIYTLRIV